MKVIRPDILRAFIVDRCCWCDRTGGSEGHYWWFRRSQGRLDHPWNLISLCRGFHKGIWVSCHEDAERRPRPGHGEPYPTKEALLVEVSRIWGVAPAVIVGTLERVRALDKYAAYDMAEDHPAVAAWLEQHGLCGVVK